MEEETLLLFQEYLEKQDTYLQRMSEDVHEIRVMQEALRTDIDQYKADEKARKKAETDQAVIDAKDAKKAAEEQAKEEEEYQKFLDGVTENMESIDTSLASMNIGQYAESFESLEAATVDMGQISRQTNSFLVILGFGVFFIIGLLLAKLVWKRS